MCMYNLGEQNDAGTDCFFLHAVSGAAVSHWRSEYFRLDIYLLLRRY